MEKQVVPSRKAIWIAVSVAVWIILLFAAACAMIRGNFCLVYSEKPQGKGLAVSGYRLSSDKLTVPETYKGKPVECVLKESFAGAPMKEVKLTSVTEIEASAFQECRNLVALDLGQVQTLGTRAFAACGNLDKVVIPGSVRQIGDEAFYQCQFLTHVYFLGEPEVMGNRVFGHNQTVRIYGPGGGQLQAYCEEYGLEFYVITEEMIEAIAGNEG